jgi:hypothetical protein
LNLVVAKYLSPVQKKCPSKAFIRTNFNHLFQGRPGRFYPSISSLGPEVPGQKLSGGETKGRMNTSAIKITKKGVPANQDSLSSLNLYLRFYLSITILLVAVKLPAESL